LIKGSKDSDLGLVSNENFKYLAKRLGPRPGNMSQNGQKNTSLITSLTKNPQPPTKKIFRVQSKRLSDLFEPLNSSLAQSAEELGR